jgi:hypothetical protein
MTSTDAIPAFPRVLAIARPDGTGEVTVNGTSHPITATDTTTARQACLDYVQRLSWTGSAARSGSKPATTPAPTTSTSTSAARSPKPPRPVPHTPTPNGSE